jgi:hypothetical protein
MLVDLQLTDSGIWKYEKSHGIEMSRVITPKMTSTKVA